MKIEEYTEKYNEITQTLIERFAKVKKGGNIALSPMSVIMLLGILADAVLKPQEVCTETYVIINAYGSELQAENLLKYFKTKFARFLVLQACSSIMVTKASYIFVHL